MQKDMHFYGVYALARAAGIKPDTARIIAYASQFVDDALEGEVNVLENQKAIFPNITSHKPYDYKNTILRDQWKVWVPFHFLPGNQSIARSFIGKMICLKGIESKPAKAILNHALAHKMKTYGAHLVGITAHVYADTFAHYGFVGLSSHRNKVRNDTIKVNVESRDILKYIKNKFGTFITRVAGTIAEAVPVGHGAVATYPDRPYLKWEYKDETGKLVKRDNAKDFLTAFEQLYIFFCNFVQDQPVYGKPNSEGWSEIKNVIKNIIEKEGKKEDRIKQWKTAIAGDKMFSSTKKDKSIRYSDEEWMPHNIQKYLAACGTLKNCNPCLFIQAAWKHKNYILYELLPDNNLIAC